MKTKAKKKARKAAAKARVAVTCIPDEEVAFRLVRLYFEEVARLGFKRKLDLDATINAYLYALQRLRNKEKEMSELKRFVDKEEESLKMETKEEALAEQQE
jgi:hypothetical protein